MKAALVSASIIFATGSLAPASPVVRGNVDVVEICLRHHEFIIGAGVSTGWESSADEKANELLKTWMESSFNRRLFQIVAGEEARSILISSDYEDFEYKLNACLKNTGCDIDLSEQALGLAQKLARACAADFRGGL